jgi:hypothetical protein
MQDNQLVELFRPIIISGLAAQGLSNVIVRRGFQSTQQGTETAPVVSYFKKSDVWYGFLGTEINWNSGSSQLDETEDQNVETTFQINTLVIQNPVTQGQMTASDLANIVAQILSSNQSLAILKASDVGMYRITGIQNQNIIDDFGQNEFCPFFEFTLTHHRDSITHPPGSTKFNAGIYGF